MSVRPMAVNIWKNVVGVITILVLVLLVQTVNGETYY